MREKKYLENHDNLFTSPQWETAMKWQLNGIIILPTKTHIVNIL